MASTCLNDSKLNFDPGLTLNVNSCLESILSFEENNYPPTISIGRKKQPVVMLPSLFPENNRETQGISDEELHQTAISSFACFPDLKIKEDSGDN